MNGACIIFTCVLCASQSTTHPGPVTSHTHSLRVPASHPPNRSSAIPIPNFSSRQTWASPRVARVASRTALPALLPLVTRSSSNTSGPALQVQYPAGSYENDDDGGARLCALWNSSEARSRACCSCMMSRLILDLTGACVGPDLHANDRSGGDQASGTKSFSSRVTLRMNDAGEG